MSLNTIFQVSVLKYNCLEGHKLGDTEVDPVLLQSLRDGTATAFSQTGKL